MRTGGRSKAPRTFAGLGTLALLACVTACDRTSLASRKLASVPAGSAIGEALFSPDGSHVGIVTRTDGKAVLFLDGKKGQPYDEIRGLVFRDGGKGFAFVAGRNGGELVVVDGEAGGQYTGVGTVRFAADGRVVYSAHRDGKWSIVVGARETAVAGGADPDPLLTADGKRLVHVQQAGAGRSRLRACSLDLKDCVDGADHQAIGPPQADPSRVRLAYVIEEDGKQTVASVALDAPGLLEKTGGWYDTVSLLGLSSGGGHLAFVARSGERNVLVKDGEELPLPEVANPLELDVSRSGRVLLTAVLVDKVVAFLDGRRVGGEYEGIYSPTLSPDGSRFAFVGERGPRSALVVSDGEGPWFDKVVTPRFTQDGKRIVYRARSDGQRFVVVADPAARTIREHPRYAGVFDVVFPPDGKSLGYGVAAGQELWWKVEKL